MIFNTMLDAAAAETTGGLGSYSSLILLAVMLVMMYFMVIRPQKKREKQATEMRNSIEVGDGITTIGGIVGIVVSTKDDTILIETGADRNKLRIMKWAVQEVEKLDLTTDAKTAAAKTADKKDKKAEKAEKKDADAAPAAEEKPEA